MRINSINVSMTEALRLQVSRDDNGKPSFIAFGANGYGYSPIAIFPILAERDERIDRAVAAFNAVMVAAANKLVAADANGEGSSVET